MLSILIKALWVTLIAYLIFLISRIIYKKFFRKEEESFFYFKSLEILPDEEKAILRIEVPEDDFEMDLSLREGQEVIFKKNARLKAGINKIHITKLPTEKAFIVMQAREQKMERLFVDGEI